MHALSSDTNYTYKWVTLSHGNTMQKQFLFIICTLNSEKIIIRDCDVFLFRDVCHLRFDFSSINVVQSPDHPLAYLFFSSIIFTVSRTGLLNFVPHLSSLFSSPTSPFRLRGLGVRKVGLVWDLFVFLPALPSTVLTSLKRHSLLFSSPLTGSSLSLNKRWGAEDKAGRLFSRDDCDWG